MAVMGKRVETKQDDATATLTPNLETNVSQKMARQHAYSTTSTTISRWQPVVKANREKESLNLAPAVQTKSSVEDLVDRFQANSTLEKVLYFIF